MTDLSLTDCRTSPVAKLCFVTKAMNRILLYGFCEYVVCKIQPQSQNNKNTDIGFSTHTGCLGSFPVAIPVQHTFGSRSPPYNAKKRRKQYII